MNTNKNHWYSNENRLDFHDNNSKQSHYNPIETGEFVMDANDEFAQWLMREQKVVANLKTSQIKERQNHELEQYHQRQIEIVIAKEQEKLRIKEQTRLRAQEEMRRRQEEAQRIEREKIEREKIEQEARIRAAVEMQRKIQEEAEKRRTEAEIQRKAILQSQEHQRRVYEAQRLQQEAEQMRLRQEILEQQTKAQELARRAIEFAQQQEILRKQQEERLLAQQEELERIAREQELFAQQEKARIAHEKEIQVQLEFETRQRGEMRLQIEKEEREREEMMRKFAKKEEEQLAHEKEIELRYKQEKSEYQQMLRAEEDEIKKLQEQVAKALKKEDELLAYKQKETKQKKYKKPSFGGFRLRDLFLPAHLSFTFSPQKAVIPFVGIIVLVALGIGSVSFAQKGLFLRGKLLGVSKDGYGNLTQAAKNLSDQNFEQSHADFTAAYENFAKAQAELDAYGGPLVEITKYIPALSKLASGKNAVEAGKHIAAAGQSMNDVIASLAAIKNPINNGVNDQSFLVLLNGMQDNMAKARAELVQAQANLEDVQVDDLPKDKQQAFLQIKQRLPEVINLFDNFLENTSVFVELLGGNGPRKYLFLFQNNNEIRATGGFIGSYGLLDVSQGRIRKFFIDGIFNPDGQLKEKIVPPLPVQKISVAWSLHDSNWFADFPTSAQKAISFYEKTGGPTADGVIALTPVVMQKLLKITGPISLPEYDVTLDSDNFIEKTQYEVEVDYDKEENKPKKILADLAPIVLDKLLSSRDGETIAKTLEVLGEGLREKHILLYAADEQIEAKIADQGWSGEILKSEKDYISVINTNINGYKTDGVIDESIVHETKIEKDGSIIDTVSITRKHTGGKSEFEWWNKVNADYMRVYVPEGSELISVAGQTREVNESIVDYDSLGFKRDPDVQKEEQSMRVDPESGTRIYSEDGKTVFANWVYVSPQESVTVTYTYKLPFSLFSIIDKNREVVDSYSLVAQKQSGSLGSVFEKKIEFPNEYSLKWSTPNELSKRGDDITLQTKLDTDRFIGIVFEKKQ